MTDAYHAASLADLAGWMVSGDDQHRWRLIAEFLEEYRHEPPAARLTLLDSEAIRTAFTRLGDKLARRGVKADIYVFGGAAMALAYGARRATRDIGALFQPTASSSTKHTTARPNSAFLLGGSTSKPDSTSRARLVLEGLLNDNPTP